MTKKELEKYTVDFMDNETGFAGWSRVGSVIGKMLIKYAEVFQKQIQIDAEQIRALQKQNGELTDKVRGLEQDLKHKKIAIRNRNKRIKELEKQLNDWQTKANYLSGRR